MGNQLELNLPVLSYLVLFSSYPGGGSGPFLVSHTLVLSPGLPILIHKDPNFAFSSKWLREEWAIQK